MIYSRTDVDPRYWSPERFARQLVFIAQDGGAGANFFQYLLGTHAGFFQQYDRHIEYNNEYISSMPLHDAEHDMQDATFKYKDGELDQATAFQTIEDACLAVLNEDEGSKFNQWDRICAQTHCPNYVLQDLLRPEHQLITLIPRDNRDHAFYRTLDVIKQWDHMFANEDECTFPLRDLDMDTPENRGKCEDWYNEGKLKTLGDMWQLLGIYQDQMHYTQTEFKDAHNSMHLYIDDPKVDALHVHYDDFFMSRNKGSYLQVCDFLRIHPHKGIYVDMVTDYYDRNSELVEKYQDTYDWFLDRMDKMRDRKTYHTDVTDPKIVDVTMDPSILYSRYNKA